MQAAADSLAFAPPAEPAAIRGFVLAVIAHLVLLIALTWGINWQKSEQNVTVEAELWSSIPQEAAPAPPPPPPPQPEVKQQQPVVEKPVPPVVKQPDIAIEREKKRKEEEARRREEELRQQEAKKKLEEQQRLAEEKKQKEELAKKEKQDKLKKELDAKRLEQLRKQNIEKALAEAAKTAGTAPPNARGTATVAKAPSASWGAKIIARVRPRISTPGTIPGDPRCEVEVRLAPDGTIVGIKVVKPSGDPVWDRAVVNALEATGTFPRDTDGSVHTPVLLGFSPRD